jgi:hypothetical protein
MKLDSDYWAGTRPAQPANGGQVQTGIEQPQPLDARRPENGEVQPVPGGFPGTPGLPEPQRMPHGVSR